MLVSGCPSKAIKVENRLAEVMPDLCVNCGTCVRVCVPKAKLIESDIEVVNNLISGWLEGNSYTFIIFSCSNSRVQSRPILGALKKAWICEVMEDAFGAEMVGHEYKRLLSEQKKGPIFSSTCPAVVSYVEKFYPQLVGNLAPIVSPMVALGRLIKQTYNQDAKVVFIGPCIAKKAESKDKHVGV